MDVHHEGKIYYFPGFEPGGDKADLPPSPDPGPVATVEDFRHELSKDYGDIRTICCYVAEGALYWAQYLFESEGETVYVSVFFVGSRSGRIDKMTNNPRHFRAMYRRASDQFMTFEEAFPGLEMNKSDRRVLS